MQVINMDENFFMEDLFAHSDGSKSVDEMREDIEWRIAEYYANYEDPDEEPVVRPVSLYMIDFLERLEHSRFGMSDLEKEEYLVKWWKDRLAKAEARRSLTPTRN